MRLLALLSHRDRRLLHGGERIAKEGNNPRKLLGREVSGLRALAGSDAEGDPVILVHRDRRVQHIDGAKHLGRLVDTVGRVAGKRLNEGGEILDRNFLRPGSLATSEGELDHRNAVVIEADFDGVASGEEGGSGGSVNEELSHDDCPNGSRLWSVAEGNRSRPHLEDNLPGEVGNLFFAVRSFFPGPSLGLIPLDTHPIS